jgi:hypothetical protein
MISEPDVNVKEPIDTGDAMHMTCPGFNSSERREDGSEKPVTTQSFSRYMAQLYRIAAPIIHTIYLGQKRDYVAMLDCATDIHLKLLKWKNSLPDELTPQPFENPELDRWFTPEETNWRDAFASQALALRTAYDNFYLLLFYPFLGTVRGTSYLGVDDN